MRAWISKRFLSFQERRPSKVLARIQLQILLRATARGFGRKGRWILFSKDPLKAYARFTEDCLAGNVAAETAGHMEPGIAGSGAAEAANSRGRERLYQSAFRTGSRVRKVTGLAAPEDLQRLVFLLYRNIGITMTGQLPGEVLVSACYFSKVYTPQQCAVMSAMDHGIIAGICGPGTLQFTERLTEGCGRCKACFEERS